MQAIFNKEDPADLRKTPRPQDSSHSASTFSKTSSQITPTISPATGPHGPSPLPVDSSGWMPVPSSGAYERSSPTSIFDTRLFQNTPEGFPLEINSPLYRSGNANKARLSNTMSESRSSASSDQSRPGSRGRSQIQASNPSRRQQIRQSFQAPLYPTSHSSAPVDGAPVSSAAPPSFQATAASYQAAPLSAYGQHGALIGQYTTSPQPPVSMPVNMPQYAYAPHHPGLHPPDASMHPPQNQLLGYNPNTPVPMVQSPHNPVFQGYGHSLERSSSSSRISNSPGPSILYSHSAHAHSPAHASPPSPMAGQRSRSHTQSLPPHSSPYVSQAHYTPMRYPTPPFAYPPHSFAPSPPIYASHSYAPSPYTPHSYASSPDIGPEGQGTWWYLPPPARHGPPPGQYEPLQNAYSMPFGLPQRDIDAYPQMIGSPSNPSPLYPVSPRQGPFSPGPPLPPLAAPDAQQFVSPALQRPSSTTQLQRPPEAGPSAAPSPPTGMPASRRGTQHLNRPAQRSEWVMWVGNVPSDTSHDELWDFLSRTPTPPTSGTSSTPSSSAAGSPDDTWGGVVSIFLISRSNCAFVNFTSEAHLLAAIQHFNGQPLRPGDPRCPRLVCRMRGREDDLKAGVGGQRSAGLHVRHVRDQREKMREAAKVAGEEARSPTTNEALTTPSSSPGDSVALLAGLSLSSDEEGGRSHRYRPHPKTSSSGSYASTNSSILMQYFPKRYFILKSLTQKDLDISVKEGLWATQRHNETTLDQAFRTSKEVYLIFGVNKSGEFYGYARMTSPIQRGEHQVSWSSPAEHPMRRRTSRGDLQSAGGSNPHMFFSPAEQRLEESPLPFSPDPPPRAQPHPHSRSSAGPPPSLHRPGEPAADHPRHSAPPEMHQAHRQLSRPSGVPARQTADEHKAQRAQTQQYDDRRSAEMQAQVDQAIVARSASQSEEFQLNPDAPQQHARESTAPRQVAPEEALAPVAEEDERPPLDPEGRPAPVPEKEGPTWGEPFKVQWVRTERLPFFRTRHLRNPWNHDREIKVSRDGTELEPSVGQALLDEWDKPASSLPATPSENRRPKLVATEEARGASAPSSQESQSGEGE